MMEMIQHELTFMIKAVLLGATISFVYDHIRILRRCIFHKDFLVTVEDICYWIWVTAEIFTLQMAENNGKFRLFSIVAATLGMLLYRIVFHNHYMRYMTKIFAAFLKLLYELGTYILSPYFYLEDRCKKKMKAIKKRLYHRDLIRKIRLTTMLKMLRITLCKRKKRMKGESENGRTQNSNSKKKTKSI